MIEELHNIKNVAIIGDVHLKLSNPRCRKDNYLNALLEKLEYIIQNNDVVICLGDLFDKASVEEQCKNLFLQLLFTYNKPFYTIWGNHDLFKYNIDSLEETSLGICIVKNAVKHLDSLKINNKYIFKEIPFVKKNPILPDADQNTILLGHFFYESEITPTYSIFKTQIENNNAKYIILGHDHTPYPVEYINNTILIRPGSTCRNTSNNYNYRIPEYTQINFNDKNEIQYKLLPIIVAKKSEDIFNTNLNIKLKNKSSIINEKVITLDFSKQIEKPDLTKTLIDIGAQNKHLECINNIHSEAGQSI